MISRRFAGCDGSLYRDWHLLESIDALLMVGSVMVEAGWGVDD